MTAPRVLAVVPARGGSKGLPGKNIRPLAGLPLVAHSLRAAAAMRTVTRCVVSTDDPEIARVATEHGGDVPWLRPADLAADDTPMAPVLRHALLAVEEAEGRPYDALVLLDPTSPARVPAEIDAAVEELLASTDLDGVVSVSEPSFNPVWVGVRPSATDPRVMERYFPEGAGVTRRQDAGRFLRINGTFYVWTSAFIRRLESSWVDEGRHAMVEIPESRAFAIDYLEEFEDLAAAVERGRVVLPWLDALHAPHAPDAPDGTRR
jgi:CMP-N,N'-diacetyllegionaminic acid synthase